MKEGILIILFIFTFLVGVRFGSASAKAKQMGENLASDNIKEMIERVGEPCYVTCVNTSGQGTYEHFEINK